MSRPYRLVCRDGNERSCFSFASEAVDAWQVPIGRRVSIGQHSNEDVEGREHDHDHGLGLGLDLSSPRHPVPTGYAEVAHCTCYLRIVCTIHNTKLKLERIDYSTYRS
jgi:hypothetical protein